MPSLISKSEVYVITMDEIRALVAKEIGMSEDRISLDTIQIDKSEHGDMFPNYVVTGFKIHVNTKDA